MKGDQYYWVNPIGHKAPANAQYVVLDIANDEAARESLSIYAEKIGGERGAAILEQIQEVESGLQTH